jgi:diacylglycerol kinase (ATP)
MRSVALLANPESGSGDAHAVADLLRGAGATVQELTLDQADRAAGLAVDRVVVAGGDGSLGCAAEAAAKAGVPLAVVPTGTANDFARALELPGDLEAALRLAFEGSRTRRLDLAWVRVDSGHARPFVNAASAGLSPVAARRAGRLKSTLGPLAYAVGALRAGVTTKPMRCQVACDGESAFSGKAWQLTVACTGFFGGGARVDADPRDGVLDAVVIKAGSRLRLIRHAYGVRAGNVESQPGVGVGAGREIEVDTDGSTGFNVDGELVAGAGAKFEVTPQAFEVVTG